MDEKTKDRIYASGWININTHIEFVLVPLFLYRKIMLNGLQFNLEMNIGELLTLPRTPYGIDLRALGGAGAEDNRGRRRENSAWPKVRPSLG